MRIRGRKLFCWPEWSILTLWHSGKHLKVISLIAAPPPTPHHRVLISLGSTVMTLWDLKTSMTLGFVQLTTSCVLSWSTVAEETCCTGSSNIKPGRSALMTWELNYLKLCSFIHCCRTFYSCPCCHFFLDLEMVCSNVFCHTLHPPQAGTAQRLEIQGTAASWTLWCAYSWASKTVWNSVRQFKLESSVCSFRGLMHALISSEH